MLTVDEARKYLVSMGITTIPDFMLALLVEQANSVNDCLAANYTESVQKLIRVYLLGLLGISQMTRSVTSERAPSGAARSWSYPEIKTRWNSLSSLLKGLDKSGCTAGVVPDNPTQDKYLSLFVAVGGDMCGGVE